MNRLEEIEKLENVLQELLLKNPKSIEDEDRIEDLKLTIKELKDNLYFYE